MKGTTNISTTSGGGSEWTFIHSGLTPTALNSGVSATYPELINAKEVVFQFYMLQVRFLKMDDDQNVYRSALRGSDSYENTNYGVAGNIHFLWDTGKVTYTQTVKGSLQGLIPLYTIAYR